MILFIVDGTEKLVSKEYIKTTNCREKLPPTEVGRYPRLATNYLRSIKIKKTQLIKSMHLHTGALCLINH